MTDCFQNDRENSRADFKSASRRKFIKSVIFVPQKCFSAFWNQKSPIHMMILKHFRISGFFNPDIRKYPDIDNIAQRLAYDGLIRPKSCKYSANDVTRYPMKSGCLVT